MCIAYLSKSFYHKSIPSRTLSFKELLSVRILSCKICISGKWSSRITYYTDVLMSTSHFCRIVGFFFSLSPKNYFLKMISKWCNAVYRNSKWSCVSISFVAAACLTKGLNVWWEYAQLKLPFSSISANLITFHK